MFVSMSGRRGAIASAVAIFLALSALAAGAHGDSSSTQTAATNTADPGAALRARIEKTRGLLLAHYKDVDTRSGFADALEARLDADESNLFIAGKPDSVSATDYWDWNAAVVGLDESLTAQLTSGATHALSGVRGLDDIPLATAKGGGIAPCAIDVPSSYSPDKAAPLVVLLHGKGVAEATEIAEPVFGGLATTSGAIIVAPYARGDDMRSPPAVEDVYAALDAVEVAFNIDRRHVYLVGDSLGGFAAFDVALQRPNVWAATLAIRSTMDPADQQPVKDQLHGKAVYIVAGAADPIVNVDDVRRSISWFRSVGIAVSYYESPTAGHDIVALTPLVQRAWRDMFASVRSLQPAQLDVPMMTPPPSQKP
jgi:predicted esterase